MNRRIIRQGNNSYTLTLPIKWMREQKLKEGDELEIREEENNLLIGISRGLKRPESSITIDLKSYNDPTIRNVLNQTYRKGYDKIILLVKEKSQVSWIREITRNTLMGFEVVHEDKEKVIVENIAEPSSEKFSIILRKIFFTIEEESREMLEDFKAKKFPHLKQHQEIRETVDNYTNFCRRVIIKDKLGGNKNSYLLMVIVSRLSLIYHAYYQLYKYAASQKSLSISKETFELLSKTNEMFRLFHEAFYTKDLDNAHKLGVLKDRLIFSTLYTQLEKTKGHENIFLYHIGEIIRLIHMESTNIFGLTDLQKLG